MTAPEKIASDPSPLGRRELLLRLTLGAASTAGALAAAEVLARALAKEPLPIRLQALSEEDPNATKFVDLLVPDPDLFWRFRPGVRFPATALPFPGIVSNAQGLRMDHEVEVPRPPDLVRILFVGDSCTFGYLLPPEQAVPWQLGERLASRLPQRRIECVNAGVPGYTLFQGCRFLETQAARYSPQLVVLGFGWNDSRPWDGLSDLEYASAARAALPPPALRWSRLAQLGFQWRARARGPEQRRARLTPVEFAALLERAQLWTRANGAALLLLVGGTRLTLSQNDRRPTRTAYQEAQYEFASTLTLGAEGGPALIDGAKLEDELFQGGARPEEIFLDGGHPTAATNARLADALADKLVPWIQKSV